MSVYAASIDDNDPQVLYSSGWELVTQDLQWRGTMHSTSVIGSWARVRFTGSRVAVVCTIPTGDGALSQASFSLDNGPAVAESHVTTPPVQWQTVFWDSGPLPFGSHLVVITNTGNNAYFRLDHIDYDPTNGNSPSTPPPPPVGPTSPTVVTTTVVSTSAGASSLKASSTGSSSSVTTSTLVSSQSSNSPNATQAFISSGPGSSSLTSPLAVSTGGTDLDSGVGSSKKSNSPTTAIIAGILGALLALLLVVGLVFFIRRRLNRARDLGDSFTGPSRRSMKPTPYNLDRTMDETSTSNLVTTGAGSNSNTNNSFGNTRHAQGGIETPRSSTPPTQATSSTSDSYSGHRDSVPMSSMYGSEASHVAAGGTTHGYQDLGNGVPGWTIGGGGVGAKHTEAFGRQAHAPTSHYGGTSAGVSEFQDAPPAYHPARASYVGPGLSERA